MTIVVKKLNNSPLLLTKTRRHHHHQQNRMHCHQRLPMNPTTMKPKLKTTSPFAIPVVSLCCSCANANGSFRNRQSLDKFSLVFDLIASLERAAGEDRQLQQEMMMQMMDQNQHWEIKSTTRMVTAMQKTMKKIKNNISYHRTI